MENRISKEMSVALYYVVIFSVIFLAKQFGQGDGHSFLGLDSWLVLLSAFTSAIYFGVQFYGWQTGKYPYRNCLLIHIGCWGMFALAMRLWN